MTEQPRILFCRCAFAQIVPREVKEEVLQQLVAAEVPFDAAADLCEMSARKDPALLQLAAQGELRIAACYPRAVKWLFSAAGAPLPEGRVHVLNMRTQSAGEITGQLLAPPRPIPSGGETLATDEAAEAADDDLGLPAPASLGDAADSSTVPTTPLGSTPADTALDPLPTMASATTAPLGEPT